MANLSKDYIRFRVSVMSRRLLLAAILSLPIILIALLIWTSSAWWNLATNSFERGIETSIDEILVMFLLSLVVALIILLASFSYSILSWSILLSWYSKTFQMMVTYFGTMVYGIFLSLCFGTMYRFHFDNFYRPLELVWYYHVVLAVSSFIGLSSLLTERQRQGRERISLPLASTPISLEIKKAVLIAGKDSLRHTVMTLCYTCMIAVPLINFLPFLYTALLRIIIWFFPGGTVEWFLGLLGSNGPQQFEIPIPLSTSFPWILVSSSFAIFTSSFTLTLSEAVILQPLNFAASFGTFTKGSSALQVQVGEAKAERFLIDTLLQSVPDGLMFSLEGDEDPDDMYSVPVYSYSSKPLPIWQRGLRDQRKWAKALNSDEIPSSSVIGSPPSSPSAVVSASKTATPKRRDDLYSYRKIHTLMAEDSSGGNRGILSAILGPLFGLAFANGSGLATESWLKAVFTALAWQDFAKIACHSPCRRRAIFSGFATIGRNGSTIIGTGGKNHRIFKVLAYSTSALLDAMTLQLQSMIAHVVKEVFSNTPADPTANAQGSIYGVREAFAKRWNGDIKWDALFGINERAINRRAVLESKSSVATAVAGFRDNVYLSPWVKLYFGETVEEIPFHEGLVQAAVNAADGLSLLLKRALSEDSTGMALEYIPVAMTSFLALSMAIEEYQEMMTISFRSRAVGGAHPSPHGHFGFGASGRAIISGLGSRELRSLSSSVDQALRRVIVSHSDLLSTFVLQELYAAELTKRIERLKSEL